MPGRLCKALGIDRSHNGDQLTGDRLFIIEGDRAAADTEPSASVETGPRVGVGYAGDWANKPYRYWLADNRWVSRRYSRTMARYAK